MSEDLSYLRTDYAREKMVESYQKAEKKEGDEKATSPVPGTGKYKPGIKRFWPGAYDHPVSLGGKMKKTLYLYEYKDGNIQQYNHRLTEDEKLEINGIHAINMNLIGTTTLEIEYVMKEVVKDVHVNVKENSMGLYIGDYFPKNSYDHKVTYKIKEPVK